MSVILEILEVRLKIIIFNREICVCALLDTNSIMRKNGVTYENKRGSFALRNVFCGRLFGCALS